MHLHYLQSLYILLGPGRVGNDESFLAERDLAVIPFDLASNILKAY
jgi:hypothetical protein